MSTYSEHVAGAQACLIEADAFRSTAMPSQTGEYKTDVIATAQVHATLALAEQQRIANLVALGVVGGGPINNAYPGDTRRYLVSEFPDIAEALGIKTGDQE